MAFVLADRVKESTTSPGTGTATLLGAATGYQSFSSGIGANNTTYYVIADQNNGANWEVGYGTIGAGGTTLARTTVLASSNSGSLVNFSSGTQDVWCDYPAKKAVILDSAGAIRGDANPYIDFEDGNGTAVAAGRMWYSNTTGAWNLGMGGGNITQQVGEELFVYGKASAAITDSPLQIIYQTGVVGASGVIQFAPTVSGITNADTIIGVATESIALNGFGRVTSFGVVHGITTNGTAYGETWADGDVIWYNPVTGNPTNVKPTAPNIKVQIGIIINAGSGGSGSIQVEINHGSVLGGTDSNVQLTSTANGNILTYDGGNSYWKNTDLTAGTGISVSKSTNGVLTVSNTGVTSVSGTAPIASSGGATPAISISQAGTSTNGYLSSTDWNTFNNKQPSGTYVTSVTGTAPVVSSGGTTPAISMAAANGTTNGYLTSTDWITFNNKQPAGSYLTAVTADAPLSGSGTSGSHLVISQAGTASNGYLSSTDWNTFNNKGSGTVTSVTGTSPIVSSGGTTPAISIGNIPVTNLNSGTGASSSTFWRGDGTWAAPSASLTVTNDTSTATALYPTFTSSTGTNITGVSVTSTKLTFVPSTGVLSATSVAGTSDERLKTNWRQVPPNFLEKLASVKSGIYDRTDVKLTQAGVSAQSLQEVLPEAVLDNGEGYLSVAYGNAALLAVIELTKEVQALRAEIEALKAK